MPQDNPNNLKVLRRLRAQNQLFKFCRAEASLFCLCSWEAFHHFLIV